MGCLGAALTVEELSSSSCTTYDARGRRTLLEGNFRLKPGSCEWGDGAMPVERLRETGGIGMTNAPHIAALRR